MEISDETLTVTERFDAAVLFAARLHRDQKRKGTEIPYLAHLLSVTALVMEDGGSEEEAIAGLLHDCVEDQGDSYPGGREALRAFLRERFGTRVLQIVDACTDDNVIPKSAARTTEAGRQAWRQRKRAYLDHLRQSADTGFRRVSCADKVHNATSIINGYAEAGSEVWQRFRTRCPEDQVWFLEELARIFDGNSNLERRFRAAAAEVARLMPQA